MLVICLKAIHRVLVIGKKIAINIQSFLMSLRARIKLLYSMSLMESHFIWSHKLQRLRNFANKWVLYQNQLILDNLCKAKI